MKKLLAVFMVMFLALSGLLHAATDLVYNGGVAHTLLGSLTFTQHQKSYFVFSLSEGTYEEIVYFSFKGKKYYNEMPVMNMNSLIVTDDRKHDYKEMVDAETNDVSGTVTSSMFYLSGKAVLKDYNDGGGQRLIPATLTGYTRIVTDSSSSSDSNSRITLKYDVKLTKKVNGDGGGLTTGVGDVVTMLKAQGYIQ